jgi:aspartate racemase
MKHIGIVACSAEGASLCYRTIVEEGIKRLGEFKHPEITMHTFPLSEYMDHLTKEPMDWETAGRVMLASIGKLEQIGCDFAICPDNTIHEGFNRVRGESTLPYLHIVEVVARTAVERGMRKLLLLGTRMMMNASFYPEALRAEDVSWEVPAPDEQQEIDRVIWEELLFNQPRASSIAYYQGIIDKYKARGCDGVVLGCTEIPLMINDANLSLPTLDSTRLLANAALQEALAD